MKRLLQRVRRYLWSVYFDHELKWIEDSIRDRKRQHEQFEVWLQMMERERAVLLGKKMTRTQSRDPVNWNLAGRTRSLGRSVADTQHHS